MGDGVYQKPSTILVDICNRLFLVGEDSFRTRRIACVCILLRGNTSNQGMFLNIHDHAHISNSNTMADSLARGAQVQPSQFVFIDVESPFCLAET